jgi:hypothetical protein
VIVCARRVAVSAPQRARYLDWIAEGRAGREGHGIRAEWVLEPASALGASMVHTVWPSHEVFDAWIATPERDALTAFGVHNAVECRPITHYDPVGGYTAAALTEEVIG